MYTYTDNICMHVYMYTCMFTYVHTSVSEHTYIRPWTYKHLCSCVPHVEEGGVQRCGVEKARVRSMGNQTIRSAKNPRDARQSWLRAPRVLWSVARFRTNSHHERGICMLTSRMSLCVLWECSSTTTMRQRPQNNSILPTLSQSWWDLVSLKLNLNYEI